MEKHQMVEEYLRGLGYALRRPQGLYAPVDYVLQEGGKRLRPVLCLMACELFGGDEKAALPVAAGLEVFHNFTLLHDDIMDNADMRRGKPTVHKVWDSNTAILSGDAMLIEAYKLVSEAPAALLSEVTGIFSTTAAGVCEGQQYDMDFERRDVVALSEYIEMIRLKTAVLLAGALKIGAVLAGASDEDCQRLYDYGINLGIAFQLRDDYLDTFGNPEVFGKKLGGDISCGKKNYLLTKAFEILPPHDMSELKKWMAVDGRDEEKIAAVTGIYRRNGMDELCNAAVAGYCDDALAALAAVKGNVNSTEGLAALVAKLQTRQV